MVTISSKFIGDYKLGDNIVYNLAILRELYAFQKAGTSEQQDLLRKPIIVTIASVAEAVLFDHYFKIKHFTREGVTNIPIFLLDKIRPKKIDQFAKYIADARSNDFLQDSSSEIYDSLTQLRKLRNRIHIQNTANDHPKDEIRAFNAQQQTFAERTLEELLKYMSENHPRPLVNKYVKDLYCHGDGSDSTENREVAEPYNAPERRSRAHSQWKLTRLLRMIVISS